MLAKGPQCTSAGVPSRVCIVVGMSASINSTVSAPVIPKSSAVRGLPRLSKQAIILPRRIRRSTRSVASARTAMISEATVIWKPVERESCSPVFLLTSVGERPMSTARRWRSLVSVTRFHEMVLGSMSRRMKAFFCSSVRSSGAAPFGTPILVSRPSIPREKVRWPPSPAGQSLFHSTASLAVDSWKRRASMAAAKRLFAAVIAWMSPVMCRLNSSIGTTCA
mmetsp:Transcript_18215/g.54966  ORF Transcript_18215/g.54966 Transcript_18215/m.54966 type:complete len:222 (-) Transcript_18215:492-1157(-)